MGEASSRVKEDDYEKDKDMSLLHLVRRQEDVVWVDAVRQREFLSLTFPAISHVLLANGPHHLACSYHHLHHKLFCLLRCIPLTNRAFCHAPCHVEARLGEGEIDASAALAVLTPATRQPIKGCECVLNGLGRHGLASYALENGGGCGGKGGGSRWSEAKPVCVAARRAAGREAPCVGAWVLQWLQ